ncbi:MULTISPECIES: GNAT family N-acetyltransferase [Enterobacteriaceae]|uniref:GNAT family N-acetyltransferase n=1 Tax=Enterobacteriaceae TaxID=543 RepID=UPI0018CDE4B4|nr:MULTISPECIES: GNAT family N-acetyltransferase [Enterobacteriaceae]
MRKTDAIISYRCADENDLKVLIDLLFDDELGSTREMNDNTSYSAYARAFTRIQACPDNDILLAEIESEIVGMLQLTLLPSLTHKGSLRAQIEGVRVKKGFRGKGIGRQLFNYAIESATRSGCHIVQLMTDRKRAGAIAFYNSLGFSDSHLGMKLMLEPSESTGGDLQ